MRNRTQLAKKTKPSVTWILVADGKRAEVYKRAVREKSIPAGGSERHRHYDDSSVLALISVPGMEWEAESPSIYEAGRDRLGRVFESSTSAHHSSEPHMDIHEEIKQHFMKMIADRLNQALEQKAFSKLVLIAPPKMLGELRKFLAPTVIKHVVAELPNDLTHCDNKALLKHLQDSGLESA